MYANMDSISKDRFNFENVLFIDIKKAQEFFSGQF